MRDIKVFSIYKHFKGGLYIVEAVAKNCDNLKEMVIYRALYDDNELWVREKEEFLSEVDKDKYPNVKQKYRFEEVILEKEATNKCKNLTK